ncbi:MAG: polyribonucleotide nucleotidyltransferase [Bacillus sp. (in: firmicutes)]
MEISTIMSQQLASLQQTVSLSLLSSQLTTGAAQSVVMLEDLQTSLTVSHPYAGTVIDVKA